MTKRVFGWTGVEVPVIGQGTYQMEGSPAAEEQAVEALRYGLDLGMTHVDTAEMYGRGRVEELVGKAVAGRRSEVFLVSKVLRENASYDGALRACEGSLNRLGTDWLDLYLLHHPSPYPITETMRAMETLVNRKQIRFIGVSNFNLAQLKAAQSALRHERLACNQVLYNLVNRSIECTLLPYCLEQGVAIVGHTPFGGLNSSPPGVDRLVEIGERLQRAPRQIVLNFLTGSPALFAIPKASDLRHVLENAGAAGWELPQNDRVAIHRVFPRPSFVKRVRGRVGRVARRLGIV